MVKVGKVYSTKGIRYGKKNGLAWAYVMMCEKRGSWNEYITVWINHPDRIMGCDEFVVDEIIQVYTKGRQLPSGRYTTEVCVTIAASPYLGIEEEKEEKPKRKSRKEMPRPPKASATEVLREFFGG